MPENQILKLRSLLRPLLRPDFKLNEYPRLPAVTDRDTAFSSTLSSMASICFLHRRKFLAPSKLIAYPGSKAENKKQNHRLENNNHIPEYAYKF